METITMTVLTDDQMQTIQGMGETTSVNDYSTTQTWYDD